jgi:hypothetical protein
MWTLVFGGLSWGLLTGQGQDTRAHQGGQAQKKRPPGRSLRLRGLLKGG